MSPGTAESPGFPTVTAGWVHEEGFATHFTPWDDDFSHNSNRYWWAFMDLQNITEPQYGNTIEMVQKKVFKLEKQWTTKQKGIETAARAIYRKHSEKALKFLTNYTNEQAGLAWDLAVKLYDKLARVEIHILADELIRRGSGTVSVAILSTNGFDATKVDFSTVRFGLASINPANRPLALNYALEDLNGNGKLDAVVTFDNYSVTSGALIRTVYNDMWLQGKTLDGNTFVARDFVFIKP